MSADKKDKIKGTLNNFNKEDVEFSLHCKTRIRQRNLDKNKLLSKLFDLNNLEDVSKEHNNKKGEKYKLKYYKSNKYDITLIVVFMKDKIKIVTAWKNNKKYGGRYGI